MFKQIDIKAKSLLKLLFLLLILSLFGLTTVPAEQVGVPTALKDGWKISSLQESGFDPIKMKQLTEKLNAGGHANAHMVIVEHDGKLVYEQYLSGSDQNWGSEIGMVAFDYNSKHDLRSITKSVTALLLGIALYEKYGDAFLSILETPVTDFYPEYVGKFSAGAEEVSLHHVLTMTDGFEWNEMDVPYSNIENDEIQLYYQADPFKFVLTRPVRSTPGASWYYSGGATMILAGLIKKLTGQTFVSYAENKLFGQLGISDYEWRGDKIWRDGLPAAASGLRLRARDLAKIGSLMLHGGVWAGKQVVPAEWVRQSSQRHTEQTNASWSMNGIYGYGYQWWHGNFTSEWDNVTAITGVGYGGQKLFVVPSRKLVVTVMAGNYGKGNWHMPEAILAEIISAAP